MIKSLIRFGLFLTIVWPPPSMAGDSPATDQEIQTQPCRPTFSCTADLTPKGGFEIEGGYTDQIFPTGTQSSTPLLLKLTVLDSLQAQIGGNGYVTDTTNGANYGYFDDIAVGLKYQFLRQNNYLPSMAITGTSSINTPRNPGYDFDRDSLVFHLSETYKWLHADFNYGLVFLRGEGNFTQSYVALAFTASVADRINVVLEGSTFSSAGSATDQNNDLIEAVQYSPKPWLTFDLAAGEGFYQRYTTFSCIAGVTYAVQLWH